MPPLATRRSPLGATGPREHLLVTTDGLTVLEIPFLTQLNLRLDPRDEAISVVQKRFGLQLPTTPNLRVTARSGMDALWLGPDEWLLVSPGNPVALAADLASVVEPHRGSVIDLSAHRTVVDLRGPRAREILESGCAIDLHPRVFPVGACAQTILARIDVIIERHLDDSFRTFVRTSFAQYLVDWIRDAVGD